MTKILVPGAVGVFVSLIIGGYVLYNFLELAFVFFFSLTSLFFLRKIATNIGLVDTPSARKKHQGQVPLVGGLSLCICLLYFLFNNPDIIQHAHVYASCIVVLVIVGTIDDKYDLEVKFRLIIQFFLSVAMIYLAKIEIHTLGELLSEGETIKLNWIRYVITVLAVMGAMNAFNMVDGLDGLLGGLSIVTFGALGALLLLSGQISTSYMCLVIVAAMVPYIMLNLGVFGHQRRVFMGDAGSMLVGYTVIWFLLLSSQDLPQPSVRPVTALWLIAIPLMDMVAIMIKRVREGKSPFKPDRQHLHHICQHNGMSPAQTLIVICSVSSVFALIGVLGEAFEVPEYLMFYGFLLCFGGYLFVMHRLQEETTQRIAQPQVQSR
ncbi:UDP-N-acetylglucosamine--undecaprenyl-phosphate N-acetylglucosaminephosphotransferase [Vibrio sp. WXL210]|uniref:UDP-N-acetylglucosamine--undecaprenyl-phosphate N-acetylglucosaminephosphotransferase n=1 Tax=Vibrio sp. WXL210 TaxID=3450709 RepID=UPI003EC77507